jgi:hypothetical protein
MTDSLRQDCENPDVQILWKSKVGSVLVRRFADRLIIRLKNNSV